MKIIAFVTALVLLTSPSAAALARGSHGGGHGRTAGSRATRATTPHAPVAARNSRDHIQRSAAARHAFARQTGFPHGRPGYVIDHITPLACGGADAPSNMQWQTVAAGKAKDKTERVGCH